MFDIAFDAGRRSVVVTPSIDEWARRVHAERARQPEKGYDADHDRIHGVKHLVNGAIDYVRRGEGEKGAAMMLAVLELVEASVVSAPPTITDDQIAVLAKYATELVKYVEADNLPFDAFHWAKAALRAALGGEA
ncbi:hypothetical protein [Microbacterium sp. PA5]|uniref:hypothetical protein n=1 Tax=Microbacterium sp. PA5 TaxID=3416654 RepID=UPI003CF9A358